MKVCSWNVNGIRAVQKNGFLDWVAQEQPDILCLQETKIQAEQLTDELKQIPGYRSYFSFAERKGYSGVATYTKEEPSAVLTGIGDPKFDGEGRILITEYPDFTLLNIYFPNGQKDDFRLQYKMEFYDALLDYSNQLISQGKKLIICGDYNTAHQEIDLKNPKTNEKRSGFLPVERAWMDKLISHGYVDTFRWLHPNLVKYSWWSYRFKAREKGVGWRIDYHFVSQNLLEQVTNADILDDVLGSDHCPVLIELQR
ncbi:exodeoxyribonuclease III [Dehalobacterium formicoaceticum]|uniref:Exodeoxyribonuclease III n=1 Tax=Dehalobacterium formicoaceticum TaxID=51515 RepID=A0ABT1Y7Q0_9FIRM|nr:exodeoxyribonuclease III [Dehalobacterium formicoaceticum]MCR6546913.1 exodeoxyribonuclease III [Dehalobacterium formicoaceticum]